MSSYKLIYRFFLLLTFVSICCSCKKLVKVSSPISGLNGDNVYNSDATAIAAVTGIYTVMNSPGPYIVPLSFTMPSLSADELVLPEAFASPQYQSFYFNNLNASGPGSEFWNAFYPVIFLANTAFEGISSSGTLTPAVKQQLLGEVKFIRAFSYYYLVNFYGDVPLILTSDYSVNAIEPRATKAEVLKQIVADLTDAQQLLSSDYLDSRLLGSTDERVRPTKWAALALISRAYLSLGDYSNAEASASLILNSNSGKYSLCNNLDSVFLENSSEAIWQLQPTQIGVNSLEARLFVLPASGISAGTPFYLNNNLLNAFESNDARKSKWIGRDTVEGVVYPYPFKYKINDFPSPVSEYEMVFRLAEIYLIRSEAEVNGAGAGISAAVNDLDVLRDRAGVANYSGAMDKASVLNAVIHERQVELFTEWGHRWIDIKRTGIVDSVMSKVTAEKGGVWSTNAQLYPVPLTDIKANPYLIQNAGY